MAAKAKTAVAKKPAGGTLTIGKMNLRAHGGKGMEGTTADSFAMPFLAVLQKGSPQVDEALGKTLRGAKEGMLFNTATKALHDGKKGLYLVFCAYSREFLRFGPRGGGGDGGGFKGVVPPETLAEMRANGTLINLEGTDYVVEKGGPPPSKKKNDSITDHRNHYVIVLDDLKATTGYQALLSLKSTQIKKSKGIMSAFDGVKKQDEQGYFTPPTFLNIVHVVTVPEQNDEGSWYGVEFEIVGEVESEELYAAALKMNENFAKGALRTDFNSMDGAGDDKKKGF